MDFIEVLDQVTDLLRQRGRLTYRTLKRQFNLDDETLDDLKAERLYAHSEVIDMAIFGAPVAHEDHASRACYAALAMQTAMQPYADEVRHTHGIEIRIRVGLNSGEVVVRTIGNDLHMDYSAVGPTVHLATRMELMAAPGSTRFTSTTLRLVEDMMQVNALGPIPIKGMTEPIDVFELTGASTIRRRLQAAETHYQQALALATELGMRPLQAHCHRALGTLYCQTGQAEQARAELSTAVDIYRDMEMTFCLPETGATLAQVGER